jgi:hypothetical protein
MREAEDAHQRKCAGHAALKTLPFGATGGRLAADGTPPHTAPNQNRGRMHLTRVGLQYVRS